MAVRPIRLFPDDVLSTPCEAVSAFDRPLRSLVDDLFDTMEHSPGVGLAAPQIGVSRQVAVVDVGRVIKSRKLESSYAGRIALINPRITQGSGLQVPREGCLSVPDLLANVRRHLEVSIEFHDAEGNQKSLNARGFEALAFQHEIDHLNGKLFLDRVANVRTDVFRRQGSA